MPRRYVYYRVPEAAVADVVAALHPVLSGSGIELLRQPEAAGGLVTLMEIHPPGSDAALEARLAALVAPWLRGERHIEVFERIG